MKLFAFAVYGWEDDDFVGYVDVADKKRVEHYAKMNYYMLPLYASGKIDKGSKLNYDQIISKCEEAAK